MLLVCSSTYALGYAAIQIAKTLGCKVIVISPRKVSAGFRMTEEDYGKLKRFALEHDLTQTEAIEKGLELLYQQYQNPKT